MVLDYIIERKILNDLKSSIIDGRYKDQKSRLKASSLKKIYYLIEGSDDRVTERHQTVVYSTRMF